MPSPTFTKSYRVQRKGWRNMKQKKLKALISLGPLIFGLLLSSCSGIPHRTFIDEMERDDDRVWVPGQHFAIVPGDTGRAYRTSEEIASRTPASSARSRELSRYERSLHAELNRRVNRLDEREYEQYRIHRQYLTNQAEELYYLELSSRERFEYIRLKGHNPSITHNERNEYFHSQSTQGRIGQGRQDLRTPASVASSGPDRGPSEARSSMGLSLHEIRSNQRAPLSMGMSKDEVMRRWGQPMRIEHAGNPRLENERWLYRVAGQDRQVYFASGRVDGWIID